MPHQLTPKYMMGRISICEALTKRNEIDPFLKRMVTEDEKCVTYYNIVRKRWWSKCGEAAQTVAKPGLMARKALLCILWDWKGIIYYELLLNVQNWPAEKVSSSIRTAPGHMSVVTCQKPWELDWEVLKHPPYPDMAPSDYHLVLALKNFLSDNKLG
ncbi:mariner Mos1 transposase [Trichonephila clavipes]|nr:mariner Mos1 transposase [Trichonephila clavipes]